MPGDARKVLLDHCTSLHHMRGFHALSRMAGHASPRHFCSSQADRRIRCSRVLDGACLSRRLDGRWSRKMTYFQVAKMARYFLFRPLILSQLLFRFGFSCYAGRFKMTVTGQQDFSTFSPPCRFFPLAHRRRVSPPQTTSQRHHFDITACRPRHLHHSFTSHRRRRGAMIFTRRRSHSRPRESTSCFDWPWRRRARSPSLSASSPRASRRLWARGGCIATGQISPSPDFDVSRARRHDCRYVAQPH